jgi:hypothetical protein
LRQEDGDRPTENSSKPASIGKQVAILLASGFFLSLGSCAGFLIAGARSGPLFAFGFAAGVAIMIGVAAWAIVRRINRG